MIHCDTESNGDTDWGGCKVDPANATDLFKLPNESCDDYCATTLWVGAADIPSFAVSHTASLILGRGTWLRWKKRCGTSHSLHGVRQDAD